jgi:hypothetical protein
MAISSDEEGEEDVDNHEDPDDHPLHTDHRLSHSDQLQQSFQTVQSQLCPLTLIANPMPPWNPRGVFEGPSTSVVCAGDTDWAARIACAFDRFNFHNASGGQPRTIRVFIAKAKCSFLKFLY